MADNHAYEFVDMGRNHYGAEVRSDPTSRYATGIFKGRSDCTWIKNTKGVFVEIKSGNASWMHRAFDKGKLSDNKGWTPQQRGFAKWATIQNGSEYFVCLFIGKDMPHLSPSKYKPRKCYLIPFDVAIGAVERAEENGHNSIPFKTRGSRTGCDLLFGRYALIWKDGGWWVPQEHPFYKYCE